MDEAYHHKSVQNSEKIDYADMLYSLIKTAYISLDRAVKFK